MISCFLESQLEFLDQNLKSGHLYSFDHSRIVAWAESIKYSGGQLTYDIVRGKANEGSGEVYITNKILMKKEKKKEKKKESEEESDDRKFSKRLRSNSDFGTKKRLKITSNNNNTTDDDENNSNKMIIDDSNDMIDDYNNSTSATPLLNTTPSSSNNKNNNNNNIFFKKGREVQAVWTDGHFYDCTITCAHRNTVDVRFYDGAVRVNVPHSEI
jgi:hypothetical protein